MSGGIKVGDRVKILRKDIAPLRHRRNHNGVVTHVNGGYILVRPGWCNWEAELHPDELRVL